MGKQQITHMLVRKALPIVAVSALLFVGIQLYRGYVARIQDTKAHALLHNGIDKFIDGDTLTAQGIFQEGVTTAMRPEDKAQFEILLATTYERTDFRRCAELYLSVINNPSYSDRTRALAASYLFLAMGYTYNKDVTDMVFSNGPFKGYLKDDTQESYEHALARGHEWAIMLTPNFLSHLLVGEYYARNFAAMATDEQEVIADRIVKYFAEGSDELATAAKDPEWDAGLIATGYRTKAVYAQELKQLLEDKKLVGHGAPTISDVDVENYYRATEDYISFHKLGQLAGVMKLTTPIYHAEFLLSLPEKDIDQLKEIADNLAISINSSKKAAGAVEEYGRAKNGLFFRFRATLVVLAREYSPTLKTALSTHTKSFSPADFK